MKNLLHEFKSVKRDLVAVVESFPAERHYDILFDKWNLKDVLAHLSNWMIHDIDCLNALKERNEPYWELNVDEFNKKGIEERKEKSWDEVYREFITLADQLINIYETLPSELWDIPVWKDRDLTAKGFLQDDISHWKDEHFGDLKEKLQTAIASWIIPKAELRLTANGKGLFAREKILKGEKAVVWKGSYTNNEGANKAKEEGKLVMQWDEDLFSIEDRGDDIGYYINHSCDPNLWMEDAYTLIAMRDIERGEELTADYVMWEADEGYISKWECNCGASNCRKTITGMDWRKKELQAKYKNHFSPLINKRILHS